VHEYPVKITKMPNHKRFFHYLVILEEKSNWIYIRERTDKDIWRKLFDFPCIEAGKNLNQKQLESSIGWKRILENQNIIDLQRSHPLIHKLTHRDLHLSFIRIYISGKLKGKKDLLRVKTSSLEKYPFPVPLKKYISSFLQELL